uniref:Mnd1 n=1 Tax=Pentatrichomonas hominis TaxID=5728 RepID=A0A0A6Z4A7_9EUKA|nr:Mnd1 [Pentatrichomonas hominis]
MSRKRGMSRDEKLIAMQELMMESNEIWTLGMLEKECPKKKGITAMSVKEILQELCDNDLVSFEKIGSGNFYWCFPSEAYNRRKVTEEKYTKQIAEMEKEIAQLEAEIAELEPGREDCEERTKLDSEIEEFGQKLAEIQKEAAKYEKLNPEGLKRTQEQTRIAFEAANRWTDNIFTVRSWVNKTFNFDRSVFDQQFNIPEDFDYLE